MRVGSKIEHVRFKALIIDVTVHNNQGKQLLSEISANKRKKGLSQAS